MGGKQDSVCVCVCVCVKAAQWADLLLSVDNQLTLLTYDNTPLPRVVAAINNNCAQSTNIQTVRLLLRCCPCFP